LLAQSREREGAPALFSSFFDFFFFLSLVSDFVILNNEN